MPKPFDVATKRLVEADPLAWLTYAGLPGRQAELIDADLSTVTSESDRIIRVQEPDYLAHMELQATYKSDMDRRVLRYNTLAYCKYDVPVQSVVVLLRKEADGPVMTGEAGYQTPATAGGSLKLIYRVVRVWEKTAEEALAGPLATLPLTPLTNVAVKGLPDIVRRMEERIERDATPEDRGMLWTTTFLLLGLRVKPDEARRLLRGVTALKESTTYQSILEEGAEQGRIEGELREARRILLRLGTRRFDAPDTTTLQIIEAIPTLEQLEALIEHLPDVESWADLLTE